ncbi:MAG: hypothetical protein AAGK22_29335 [Acidobacteriota bacterium]
MKNFTLIVSLAAGLAFVATAAEPESLYVKVEDLVPSGGFQFSGADIDAVELANAAGTVRFYASDVAASKIPKNVGDHALDPASALGPPTLIDSSAPYVVSLNGGSVVVAIDTMGVPTTDDWQVQVFEVDGTLYENGAPEPYRVSISESPQGPWKELGAGSGVARFSLGGGDTGLSEEERDEIQRIVARPEAQQELVGSMKTIVGEERSRIQAIETTDQVVAELAAYLEYYEKREHDIVDHGGEDNGSLQAAAQILAALDVRLRQLSASH